MTNPITSFSAIEFLVFYGVVIALVVGLCVAYLRARDRTRFMIQPSMPDRVDPYEVAYLRGAQNELTRSHRKPGGARLPTHRITLVFFRTPERSPAYAEVV